ncbi:hypothetical protein VTN77DRAFT_2535 [Rasamsonia byssochlamydoides]|uniref:uncharacterized protein n=1 Tax=Rasamsonia byssochlamydoides TaxID=89139 RepID=UPI003743D1FE
MTSGKNRSLYENLQFVRDIGPVSFLSCRNFIDTLPLLLPAYSSLKIIRPRNMSKANFAAPADDAVPSYEESIRSSPSTLIQRARWQGPLHQQLDETRLRRIHSILSTYVDPLLMEQAASGLYKSVLLLIPSNVPSLQNEAKADPYSPPKEPEIVGFPSDEVVKLVRLDGEEYTLEFWRQPAVMDELGSSLRARLALSGHRVEAEPDPSASPESQKSSISASSPTTSKKSFWGRTKKSFSQTEAYIVDRKLGWRADDENYPKDKVLPKGQVRVRVQWREVCLRVENQLGLYETRKGPGICLTVEVGS